MAFELFQGKTDATDHRLEVIRALQRVVVVLLLSFWCLSVLKDFLRVPCCGFIGWLFRCNVSPGLLTSLGCLLGALGGLLFHAPTVPIFGEPS